MTTETTVYGRPVGIEPPPKWAGDGSACQGRVHVEVGLDTDPNTPLTICYVAVRAIRVRTGDDGTEYHHGGQRVHSLVEVVERGWLVPCRAGHGMA